MDLSSAGLKTELKDGDIVRLLHISPRFDNAITLRGNVAVPGRYPWRQGMRVKDLIPSRDALVTQEFWKRQNKLAVDLESLTFKSREEVEQDRQQRSAKPRQERSGEPARKPDGAKIRRLPLRADKIHAHNLINARSSSGMKTWLHAWAGQKRNALKRNN